MESRLSPCTTGNITDHYKITHVDARIWAALVAAAFCMILLNALYGHHVYGSPYGQALTKYSVYVHLQPGWDSAPANILYDVAISWDGSPEEGESYNSNHVLAQRGREAVVLQHGFSDCSQGWSPPLYRYGADVLRSHIRHAQGLQLNLDPYTPQLPDVPNVSYSDDTQASLVRDGYVQFVPVCGGSYPASFQYAVSVNDPDAAFDVHFVPSRLALDDYLRGGDFPEYASGSCGAANRISYTGFCDNVGPDSGLLIVLPDILDLSLTKVSVGIRQLTSSPGA